VFKETPTTKLTAIKADPVPRRSSAKETLFESNEQADYVK